MSNLNLNVVTWSLALLPENATKIDQINQIILGSSNSAKAPIEKAKETVAKTDKPDTSANETEQVGVSQADLQAAAKAAKTEHGVDFVKECIEAAGGTLKRALGQSLSSIAAETHASFIQDLKDGPKPTEQASDELEDDGFDDDEDSLDDAEEAPTVEAVKAALKAYAKETGREEAKQIMNDNGAAKLQNVDDCTPAQLTAMFKALV
jgi:hypothetical protein